MSPTKLSELQAYTSPWLKASDLQGRAATVTIETATVEEIRQQTGQKEARIVVAFAGKSKRLICNKTQALTLADLAKTEVFANWRGLTVTLEPGRPGRGKTRSTYAGRRRRPLRRPGRASRPPLARTKTIPSRGKPRDDYG